MVKDDYYAWKLLEVPRERATIREEVILKITFDFWSAPEPILTNQKARIVEISNRKISTVQETRAGDNHIGTLLGSETDDLVKLRPSKI